jgi:GT2 family glycosyltransferase
VKKASVIIPFRENIGEMRVCLSCLEQQSISREAFEVLAVNNGPNTGAALDELMACFPSVRWLADGGPGSYGARNRGIGAAQGEIIAFTDGDCQPDPQWLENGIRALEREEASIVGGRVAMLDPVDRALNIYEQYESLRFGLGNQKQNVERKSFTTTACLITYRSLFDRVGLFDGDLTSSGDRDWVERAILAGEVLVYSDDAIVYHPRRSTFPPLLRKTRRVAGGRMFLLKKRNMELRYLCREIWSQSVLRLNTHRFAARAKGVAGWWNRLRFFILAEALFAVATAERVRVFLGCRPKRN